MRDEVLAQGDEASDVGIGWNLVVDVPTCISAPVGAGGDHKEVSGCRQLVGECDDLGIGSEGFVAPLVMKEEDQSGGCRRGMGSA